MKFMYTKEDFLNELKKLPEYWDAVDLVVEEKC